MTDDPQPGHGQDDVSDWLPYDDDSEGGEPHPPDLSGFSYIGRGLTPQEFTDYLATYDFGPIKPDFVILHHTAGPTWEQWTAGDANRNDQQIYANRLRRTGVMKSIYEGRGWKTGPHLFVDDRWIWLFSEMSEYGTHAKWGNSFKDASGTHYSIGIEVIGDYTHTRWSEKVAGMVAFTVRALQKQLGTFELKYIDNKPARKKAFDPQGHPFWEFGGGNAKMVAGGISSHRDYNKPACPGNMITDEYYMEVIRGAATTKTMTATASPYQPGTYVVSVPNANIWESPERANGQIALGGTAKLSLGTELEIDAIDQGESINGNIWWGHLKNQIGFVSMTIVNSKA